MPWEMQQQYGMAPMCQQQYGQQQQQQQQQQYMQHPGQMQMQASTLCKNNWFLLPNATSSQMA